LLPCIISPIPSCAVWAAIFHGIDAAQGHPLSIRAWGMYTGGLVAYHAMVCPMEVIHGRRSALHNAAAASTVGYIGVASGRLGVPFVNPHFLYTFRHPALIGAAVYGAMGGALAAFGGKPI